MLMDQVNKLASFVPPRSTLGDDSIDTGEVGKPEAPASGPGIEKLNNNWSSPLPKLDDTDTA